MTLKKKDKIQVGLRYDPNTKQAEIISVKSHEWVRNNIERRIVEYEKYNAIRETWSPRGTWDRPPIEPDSIQRLIDTAPYFNLPRMYFGKLKLFTRTHCEYYFSNENLLRIREYNHSPLVEIPHEFFKDNCENFSIEIPNDVKVCASIDALTLAYSIRDNLICEDGSLSGSFRFIIGSGNSVVRIRTPLDAIPKEIVDEKSI